MSSKALRKLNKLQLEDELKGIASFDEPETAEGLPTKSKAQNSFAFLPSEDDSDDDSQQDDRIVSSVSRRAKPTEKVVDESSDEFFDATEENKLVIKKPLKGKSSGKHKKTQNTKQPMNSDEELDQILEQLKIKQKEEELIVSESDSDNEYECTETVDTVDSGYKYFTLKKFAKTVKLLKIHTANLDPDYEFRSLFGKISDETIKDADSTSSGFVSPEVLQQIKKLSRMTRGWGGRDHRSIPGTTRKLKLTKIRDDWIPTVKKSLAMEEIPKQELISLRVASRPDDWRDSLEEEVSKEISQDIKYYRFKFNLDHLAENANFYASVVIAPDHQALIDSLQRSPYHIPTLLQISTILMRQGDKSNSSGLVERALFVFDRGFLQNFELGNGKGRFPFESFLNRQFYLALFRYIEALTQRSTFLTALTYCKLLLSLNPTEDPYGVRFFIDFYCIMSEEYEYLIDLSQSSLVTTYKEWLTPGIAFSTSLAYLRSGETTENVHKAATSLKSAFQKFPYIGFKIYESLNSIITSQITKLFKNIPAEQEILAQHYIVRLKTLWSDPKSLTFLEEELYKSCSTYSGTPEADSGLTLPTNLLRHVILSGEGTVMAKLPETFWNQNEVYEFDVLPPTNGDSITDYMDDKIVTEAVMQATSGDSDMTAIRRLIETMDQ